MCDNPITQESYRILEDFINSFPDKKGILISVLHKAQEIFGYLPEEVQLFVSTKLKIPAAKVYGVVTFYSFFTMTPKGENKINVCLGTACFVRGSEKILEEFQAELGIQSGQVTSDGRFSIDSLHCVGACGLAPVVMINDKVYGRVKVEDVKKIIQEYTKKEA